MSQIHAKFAAQLPNALAGCPQGSCQIAMGIVELEAGDPALIPVHYFQVHRAVWSVLGSWTSRRQREIVKRKSNSVFCRCRGIMVHLELQTIRDFRRMTGLQCVPNSFYYLEAIPDAQDDDCNTKAIKGLVPGITWRSCAFPIPRWDHHWWNSTPANRSQKFNCSSLRIWAKCSSHLRICAKM